VTVTKYAYRSPRLLPLAWPVWLVFGLYPLWWVLGLGIFMWAMTAVALIFALASWRHLRVPAGFLLLLLFLGWVVVSLSQVTSSDRLLAWMFRSASYTCGAMLFLYLYNAGEDKAPTRLVVRVMALFWCFIAVGGLVALIIPNLAFDTPIGRLLPQSIAQNGLIQAYVQPEVAQPSRILGFLVPRPQTGFPYTNSWGASYALSFPFVALSWQFGGRVWVPLTRGLAIASVVPVVFSLDRGVWLSLGVGLVYAALRLAAAGQAKSLVAFASTAIVLVILIIGTPLGGLVVDRTQTGHSDDSRSQLYSQSVALAQQSPVFGYGSPQPNPASPDDPAVGTHGQLWLVLVSQGVPGLLLFLGWYAYAFVGSLRRRHPVAFWCHIVIVVAIVQLAFYEQLPAPFSITAVAAALAIRGHVGPATSRPRHAQRGEALLPA
jgi:hypothetical protein